MVISCKNLSQLVILSIFAPHSKQRYEFMISQMVTYHNVTSTNPTQLYLLKIIRYSIFIVKSLKNE